MVPVPYPLTDKDVLYYLHIPKTAGTSFSDILSKHFSPEQSSFSRFIHEFLKLPPEQLANLRAVSGHYFYNIQDFIPRNPVYITMLRDPVERTISIYAQISRMPTHYAHDIVKTQSLLDFVTDERTKYLYANSQTRYIAADPNTMEIAKKLTPEALKGFDLWERMERYAPTGYANPALLECALERLHKMAFVGLAEKYDESVEVLCYTFGWPTPEKIKMLNVSGNRPTREEIPQEALDIIRQNTALDTALYETGKQIFEASYAQMLKDHPEKAREDITIDDNDVVAKLQRQIDHQKRLIESLQEERTQLQQHIARVQAIYENSWGWQFVLRFNAARKKFIPEGSLRESLYRKVRNVIVGS